MSYFTWKAHQIFYRQQGSGPLLLVLPGNTATSTLHQGELAYFSDRYCTASLDFLGTGQSDRVAEWSEHWWVDAADQAIHLVDHLEYSDCILMGVSGGAAVALLAAIHYPERVKAVIADSCVERFTMKMADRNVRQGRLQRTPEQVQFWQSAQGDDWEQVIDADTTMLLHFAEQGGDWFAGRLKEIRCPVLLSASRQDSFLPNVVRELAKMSAQIADSMVFINGSGEHPLMWSSPDDFRSICDQFLSLVTDCSLNSL
ncbi:MAG: alpha/beta fold hydrolase [Gammaproteobacteria bacterium]|nr:alpha/beta fold hydrolase [Gammaproteobacteria bacterium]